ncbi:MAG: 16S rRNA (cytosine(1402)-N(4))-methyltransferase, partial [Acidimicrobiales bacterium]
AMIAMLVPGGIGLVLTYHSGEDRIAKDRLRHAIEGDAPAGLRQPTGFAWAWRGARTPTDAEIERNPRARSARLRAIVRERVTS